MEVRERHSEDDRSDGKQKNGTTAPAGTSTGIFGLSRPVALIIIAVLITFAVMRDGNPLSSYISNSDEDSSSTKNGGEGSKSAKNDKKFLPSSSSKSSSASSVIGAAPAEAWIPETQKLSYTNTPSNCTSWEALRDKYHWAAGTPGDISQHVPILRVLGASVPTILELGVRTVVSSWAFGMAGVDRARQGLSLKYTAGDITRTPSVDELENLVKQCASIDFNFVEGDDLKIPDISADLIFIDTWHVYRQLHLELIRYSKLARKYIVLHDTTLFGEVDESIHGHGGKPEDPTLYPSETKSITGLWPATEELLKLGEWRVLMRGENNNGLTVLIRNGV